MKAELHYKLNRIINEIWDAVVLPVFAPKLRTAISKKLSRSSNDKKKICFVCTGNICRSPFSHYQFPKFGSRLEIDSAGIFAGNGKPADPTAKSVASKFSVDLQFHRTKPLTEEIVSENDLILVMEPWQLVRIWAKFPGSRGKAFLLSTLLREKLRTWSIADPFDRGPEHFKEIFGVLVAANEELQRISKQIP
ncbi:MAG TPA: protein tyrosine phosphatase [Oligoflexia bacterium]|nr:protein tyrosine phosphatase [Oligoflexia bacterium]HMP48786.1 protein tyrosine phosphatase [Oligoflexia bacterium]